MHIARGRLIIYCLPALPLSMLLAPIIIYLPAFYAEHLGTNLSALGVIFFIGRLWDGLADPVVGRLSDRYGSRFGRRKPWIVLATPFLLATTYFLCRPPRGATVSYLLITIILFYVCYTVVRIPYISWGAELSSDYRERNRISGWREIGSMTGIMISIGAPYFWLRGTQSSMDHIMEVFTAAVFVLRRLDQHAFLGQGVHQPGVEGLLLGVVRDRGDVGQGEASAGGLGRRRQGA